MKCRTVEILFQLFVSLYLEETHINTTSLIYQRNTYRHYIEYIYICYHENNAPSQLSPQWLCGNSCTGAHDVRLHTAGTNEPRSAQQTKQGA